MYDASKNEESCADETKWINFLFEDAALLKKFSDI